MQLVLRDINPHVVLAWTQVFGGRQGVSFGSGDVLLAGVDAVVSPANGAGIMDGGIDLHYRNQFGAAIEVRLRELIEQRFAGDLPIGEALVIPTKHAKVRRMIAAPTMATPRSIRGTDNVRRATLAALHAASRVANPPIERLGIPGMGTGVGRMDPFESAEQMRAAFDEWVHSRE
ncbi:macro domain-containing protein [Nannocystaceae bacterium ST9]